MIPVGPGHDMGGIQSATDAKDRAAVSAKYRTILGARAVDTYIVTALKRRQVTAAAARPQDSIPASPTAHEYRHFS